MKKHMQFPDGFYWGAATSAYQVEGGIENNDWTTTSLSARFRNASPEYEYARAGSGWFGRR